MPNEDREGTPQAGDHRAAVTSGVFWNTLYQAVSVPLQLLGMLVLVRVIEPREFGKVTVVLGVLHLLGAFSCARFVAHGLQLPEGEEPNWSLHWHCAIWIQAGLFGLCNAIAGACWLIAEYREVAGLLHLASLGLLIDAPSQIRLTQLQRNLDFKRLRTVLIAATILSLAVSVSGGVLGLGAWALVLSGNVIVSLPISADLLLVQKWRPKGPWFSWPNWKLYRRSLRFGLQQSAAGVLRSVQGVLAATILPLTLGYEVLGLLSRAEALFTSTVQRIAGVLGETAYPLLPRYATDQARFSRVTLVFVSIMSLILIPGAAFVAFFGVEISRLLYGERWISADPLLAPYAMAGLAIGLYRVGYRLLLAKNRLSACLKLDGLLALLGCLPVVATFLSSNPETYAWAVSASLALGSLCSLLVMRRDTPLPLATGVVLPIGVATVLALCGVLSSQAVIPTQRLGRLGVVPQALLYAGFGVLSLRVVSPSFLARLLPYLPYSKSIGVILRLGPNH